MLHICYVLFSWIDIKQQSLELGYYLPLTHSYLTQVSISVILIATRELLYRPSVKEFVIQLRYDKSTLYLEKFILMSSHLQGRWQKMIKNT